MGSARWRVETRLAAVGQASSNASEEPIQDALSHLRDSCLQADTFVVITVFCGPSWIEKHVLRPLPLPGFTRLLHPATNGYFSPSCMNSNRAPCFSKKSWRTNLFFSPRPFEKAHIRVRTTLPSKNQDGWLGVTQLLLYGRPAHGCTLPAASILPSVLPSFLPPFFPLTDFTPRLWIFCAWPCWMHFNLFLSIVHFPLSLPRSL